MRQVPHLTVDRGVFRARERIDHLLPTRLGAHLIQGGGKGREWTLAAPESGRWWGGGAVGRQAAGRRAHLLLEQLEALLDGSLHRGGTTRDLVDASLQPHYLALRRRALLERAAHEELVRRHDRAARLFVHLRRHGEHILPHVAELRVQILDLLLHLQPAVWR